MKFFRSNKFNFYPATFYPATMAAMLLNLIPLTAIGATSSQIVLSSEVPYIPLNPARGDASPRSGKLWGNIRENEPAGMLVKFSDGFESPPHIHNITYRGVVISGEVHNDDPDAAKMWMGPGSFWTQPAGEEHITAARGEDPTIFLEILSGPYLVQPSEDSFDNGELPVNVAADNLVWLGAVDSTWITAADAEIAFLWGNLEDEEKNGTALKLKPGFDGIIKTESPVMHAVTIQGRTTVELSGQSSSSELAPGGYFASNGSASHKVSCRSDTECVLYLHTEGKYEITAE
jgi:quercetin dioxygenase-like cupin family protein